MRPFYVWSQMMQMRAEQSRVPTEYSDMLDRGQLQPAEAGSGFPAARLEARLPVLRRDSIRRESPAGAQQGRRPMVPASRIAGDQEEQGAEWSPP